MENNKNSNYKCSDLQMLTSPELALKISKLQEEMPEDHHARLVYHCTNDINYKKIVEKGFRFGKIFHLIRFFYKNY